MQHTGHIGGPSSAPAAAVLAPPAAPCAALARAQRSASPSPRLCSVGPPRTPVFLPGPPLLSAASRVARFWPALAAGGSGPATWSAATQLLSWLLQRRLPPGARRGACLRTFTYSPPQQTACVCHRQPASRHGLRWAGFVLCASGSAHGHARTRGGARTAAPAARLYEKQSRSDGARFIARRTSSPQREQIHACTRCTSTSSVNEW